MKHNDDLCNGNHISYIPFSHGQTDVRTGSKESFTSNEGGIRVLRGLTSFSRQTDKSNVQRKFRAKKKDVLGLQTDRQIHGEKAESYYNLSTVRPLLHVYSFFRCGRSISITELSPHSRPSHHPCIPTLALLWMSRRLSCI